MALGQGYARQECSLARALELVGERWTMLVLRDCFFGVRRFTDFLAHLDIPRAVLMSRLRDLVDAGILRREPYTRGRDEYLLTPRGVSLWPALFALMEWGAAGSSRTRVFRHVGCGTDLAAGGGCPTCGGTPPADDLEIRPSPESLAVRRRTDAVSVALLSPHRLLEPLLLG
ncbi:winged helix-turn-helix transcriptional regulator [Jatrophihabitans sp. YIM 134969]